MSVGDLVPLATIGTTMANGMEIAARKMRGEASNGMLCSAAELELPETKGADGILILENGSAGQPLAEALDLKTDIVFDLDIEGNRPDALSVAGVARDLAARLQVRFTLPTPNVAETGEKTADVASVRIDDPGFCPRFGVRVLRDVTVGESPAWMQQRLSAAGMRPINSIVDISNYVMLELGQPNHSYDLDKVPDGALVVRIADSDESLTTLDDVKRQLDTADGVISNGKGEPIGLAGVMGGASTEIGLETTNVLLEAAVWDRMPIAWTARRLNLRSEASTRFERGVDPFGIELALDRFAELAVELCGATIVSEPLIVEGTLPESSPIEVRVERINKILNLSLTATEVQALLSPIGFASEENGDGTLRVTIPSWRPDAHIEEDVIEEVGRHHGYDKSGVRVPRPAQTGELTTSQKNRRRLRRAFLASGFSEAMPLPFIAPADLKKIGSDIAGIEISQPLVADESILRPSLLPGLVKAVAYNEAHQTNSVRLFEVGKVFAPGGGEGDGLPVEREMVAAIASGFTSDDRAAEWAVRHLYELMTRLGLAGVTVRNAPGVGLHPGRSAEVVFRGSVIGHVGEIDPAVLESYEVSTRTAWLSLDLAPLLGGMESKSTYSQISRFPSSDVDLAFLVPTSESAIDVEKTLRKAGKGYVQRVELFDVFRSDELGPDMRSLAYGLRLQAADRTLEDADLTKIRTACIDAMKKFHNASLR